LIAPHDFRLGPIHVRPAARAIESSKGRFVTEPLVMQLLIELCRKAGRVVTRREIFERCWGPFAVGDDSLNRIVASLRKTLAEADGATVMLETVPGAGYSLRLCSDPSACHEQAIATEVEVAVQDGLDSVRGGLPETDYLRLEMLRRATLLDPRRADAWGMRALLCRYGAEYAEPGEVSELVAECEGSARGAVDIDPREPSALVALATVAPIFGRWLEVQSKLTAILDRTPDEFVANHELIICDMATGRVRAAVTRTDKLISRDPLAACLIYKGIYQHWSASELPEMDELAERGIQLWPTHAAIWTARLWTFAFSGRISAAAYMLTDEAVRPDIPPPTMELLKVVIKAAASGSAGEMDRAAAVAVAAAASGPARAITALFALGLLNRLEDWFAVADGYYLRQGTGPVPVHRTTGEPSINDQHRRVTQILFTPACRQMREDPRFLGLCNRIGLSAYWEQTGFTPDFLA
jgi:DNA-binding winged helix-turn-helix (wHTH) protein